MNSYEFVLFIIIWKRILRAFGTTSRELQSKIDLTVASRLTCYSISELVVLRESLDFVKQTAFALASAWHTVVDFKLKQEVQVPLLEHRRTIFSIPQKKHSKSISFIKLSILLRCSLNKGFVAKIWLLQRSIFFSKPSSKSHQRRHLQSIEQLAKPVSQRFYKQRT